MDTHHAGFLIQLGRLWAAVTYYLSSRDLVRLYRAANRPLRDVLTNKGGVTHITHQVTVPSDATFDEPKLMRKSHLWPRFLLVRFRSALQSLHIVGIPDLYFIEPDPAFGLVDFQVLPTTLTSLEVPFHFHLSNELVNALPPNLKSLKMAREYRMPSWVVSSWPATLTAFESRAHGDLNDTIASQLPETLVLLSLPNNHDLTSEFIKPLSKRLSQLAHLDLSRNKNLGSEDFARLPRSLTHLNVACLTRFNSDHVPFLPPKLTVLECSSVNTLSDTAFLALPRTLTNLNFEKASLGYSSSALRHLPPALVRLCLGITNHLDYAEHGANVFPKTLKHLSLDRASTLGDIRPRLDLPNLLVLHISHVQLDDATAALLPKSLTVLNIVHAFNLTGKGMKALPENLLYLAYCPNLAVDHPNDEQPDADAPPPEEIDFRDFPPNIRLPSLLPLKVLRILAYDYLMKEIDNAYSSAHRGAYRGSGGRRPDRERDVTIHYKPVGQEEFASVTRNSGTPFSPLPRIYFESWLQETLTPTYIGNLPNDMEYLDITLATNLKGTPYFERLPHGLLELYLPVTSPTFSSEFQHLPRSHLESLFIGDSLYACLPAKQAPTIDSILSMAPTLYTSHMLPYTTRATISGAHFGHLPRTLKHLIIQTWTQAKDEDVKALPPLLLTLYLSPETTLTNVGLKYLPKGLTYLNLSTNPNITDQGIQDLPRTLTYLNVARAYLLSDACVRHLPPSLQTFIACRSRLFTDASFKQLPPTLTHLNWDFASSINDAGVAHLPRGLTHLSLRHALHLTNACIKLLPRKLKVLKLTQNSQVTSQCLEELPPSLERFEAAFTTPLDTIYPTFPPLPRQFNPAVLSKR